MSAKAHDDINATYFPQELIEFQEELLHPYHNGLFIRLSLNQAVAMAELKDYTDLLVAICTELNIPLDGEYTDLELLDKVLPKLQEERRLANLIIVNRMH